MVSLKNTTKKLMSADKPRQRTKFCNFYFYYISRFSFSCRQLIESLFSFRTKVYLSPWIKKRRDDNTSYYQILPIFAFFPYRTISFQPIPWSFSYFFFHFYSIWKVLLKKNIIHFYFFFLIILCFLFFSFLRKIFYFPSSHFFFP